MLLDLLHDLLQALFEIAAIAGAGEQRPHVEGEDRRIGEHFRHFAAGDLAGEPLGDRGLADAGLADEQRVVLLPAAQNLDRALHFGLAADQRIDAALARLLVEIDAIGVERTVLLLAVGSIFLGFTLLAMVVILLGSTRRFRRIGEARPLGDAVRNVIDRVVTRHVLLLQKIGGMAFALGENRDQHVGAGHLLAPGGLHMDHGALDDALEAGRRLGILTSVGDQILEFVVDIFDEVLLQHIEVDRAGPHDRGAIRCRRSGSTSRCSSVAYS